MERNSLFQIQPGTSNNVGREEKKSNWLFDFITLIHLHRIHLIRQLQVTRYNGTKFPPHE